MDMVAGSPEGYALETATFHKRRERSEFVARRFAPYFTDAVLDVGCYDAPLRTILHGVRYMGVDIAGAPDQLLDLDAAERLPFADGQYRCVICIEVLEHLENLHRMVGELVRVSGRHVIVSLPNCWRDARRPIERGRGNFAHYGLPPDRPLDRHRWFFSYMQARDFLLTVAARHSLRVVELFGTEQRRPAPIRLARHLTHSREAYLNRYAQTIWCVFEKPSAAR